MDAAVTVPMTLASGLIAAAHRELQDADQPGGQPGAGGGLGVEHVRGGGGHGHADHAHGDHEADDEHGQRQVAEQRDREHRADGDGADDRARRAAR